MNSKRTPITIILLLAFSLPVRAADLGDWMAVQSLHSGTKIRVTEAGGARREGRFQGATESALTIATPRPATFAKEKVTRVDRRSGWSRKKRALLGAAIGLAAGGVMAGAFAARLNNEGFGSTGIVIGLSLAGGAGIGAGVGALTGNGTSTIYRGGN